MKRRTFLTSLWGGIAALTSAWCAALTALGLRKRPARVTWITRPWSDRAAELFEREGHYADLVAWEEWISAHWPDFAQHDSDVLEDLDRVALWHCFCVAIDQSQVREGDPASP